MSVKEHDLYQRRFPDMKVRPFGSNMGWILQSPNPLGYGPGGVRNASVKEEIAVRKVFMTAYEMACGGERPDLLEETMEVVARNTAAVPIANLFNAFIPTQRTSPNRLRHRLLIHFQFLLDNGWDSYTATMRSNWRHQQERGVPAIE